MAGAAGLDVVGRVREACAAAGEQDPLDEATWLRVRHHGLDGAHLDVEPDGFALVVGTSLDLAVAPGAREAGSGGRLVAAALGAEPLTAWSHGDHPAAARLAERHGWRRARELWVMRRALTEPLPDVVVPAGVRIRSFRPDDADAVLTVNAEAFAHHPEQGGLDADGFAERQAESWFDPAGLLLAVGPDDRLLGFHWTKEHSPSLGEVYVVGISPAAQGRGLGRTLTLAGLHHLAARGLGEVHLYVESDNAPALATYRGLGFAHASADTHVQYAAPPRQ